LFFFASTTESQAKILKLVLQNEQVWMDETISYNFAFWNWK